MVNYAALAVALLLSSVAAYYSILGLTAIFAAAFWPIVVMGVSLEIAKVVATSWVYRNWNSSPLTIKWYLISAVVVLMLITSMGTFGYLSKAHSDQSLVSGEVMAKIAVYDEKIKTAKENIESARKQLKQMDEAVDQVMARSTTEQGADRANTIRRSQSRDRVVISREIETNQKLIAAINEESAPIRAEVRKVEAEVGPLKYIAELLFDSSEENVLARAVRWVTILIVIVFDPLALALLLAANHGLYGTKTPQPTEPSQSWLNKTTELIKRKKKGIIEIDEGSVMRMK